ncbi:MAG: hypothetical protein NT031_20460, partial [Planctomycetota bacterium]|nr:hypothetical protein [Planctomycetota bacterium]
MKNFLIGAALLAIVIVVAINAGHRTPPAVEPEPTQSSAPPLLYPVSPADPGANAVATPVGEPTVAVAPVPAKAKATTTAAAPTAAAPVSERAVAIANLPT